MEILQKNKSQSSLHEAIEQIKRAFSRPFDPDQQERLLLYFSLLHQWNKSINLTGIKEPELLVYKHLGDTLLFDRAIPPKASNLLDIGTGAGIPGLLLKILRPNLNVVLAEAVKKKCSFLRYVISVLDLSDIHIEEKRLEANKPPEHMPAPGFDVIVSQAAGSLKWLLNLSLPLLKQKGTIIAIKGPAVADELSELEENVKQLGLSVKVAKDRLPILDHTRMIIHIIKEEKSQPMKENP